MDDQALKQIKKLHYLKKFQFHNLQSDFFFLYDMWHR